MFTRAGIEDSSVIGATLTGAETIKTLEIIEALGADIGTRLP